MQTLQAAIGLMTGNCFMGSIDWKDAYYSVAIDKHDRKLLFYQFTCLPNGLASAPRLFTKLTKPFFANLKMYYINAKSQSIQLQNGVGLMVASFPGVQLGSCFINS